MRQQCDTGGRFLHWIGYRYTLLVINLPITDYLRSSNAPKKGKGSDFSYLGKFDPLLVDAWRPNNPNSKTGNQCLVSYLGLEPNASW